MKSDVLFYEDGILIEKDLAPGISIVVMNGNRYVRKNIPVNEDSVRLLNRLTAVLSSTSQAMDKGLK